MTQGLAVSTTETRDDTAAQASLAEFLTPGCLQQIQDEFASALGAPVRILGEEGAALTGPSPVWGGGEPAAEWQEGQGELSVPVVHDGQPLGWVAVEGPAGEAGGEPGRCRALLRFMAYVLADRWSRQRHLQSRIGELTAMFRLAGEFATGKDPGRVLDLLARTVVRVLQVEGCCIRLLSGDRQELITAAGVGVPEALAGRGRMPVADSGVDAHVLKTRRPTYAVRCAGGVRALSPGEAEPAPPPDALCIPLSYKGWYEGVVHVYLGRRGELDWYELSLLQAVMAQGAGAIVGTRLHREAIQAAELRRDMQMAGEVQQRMIPDRAPDVPGFEIAVVYEPTYELSGDFYDFLDLPDGRTAVVVCDVVGKGARASLLMASIRASLRAHAAHVHDAARMLEQVNRDLVCGSLTGDFATLFYGVLDPRRRRLTYASAGHCPSLHVRAGRADELPAGGMVLGVDADLAVRTESLVLRPGDVLLAYTDGLTEARSHAGELFGCGRLERALTEAIDVHRSAGAIVRHVLWHKRLFVGLQAPSDDLTMVAIQVL